MITGKTKTLGIIGWPVSHSFSPNMHNTAFAALELDYIYVPLPVHPDHLGAAVAGLKTLGFVGANVTIPHKVAIMPFLDELDESAKLAGAVNTIVVKNGRCIGYNTDGQGFIKSLTAQHHTIAGKTAILMGAGGAARAVVGGLLQNGITEIIIGARSPIKAQEFVDLFPGETLLKGYDWQQESFTKALETCDFLINCTPIGMSSHKAEELPLSWERVKKEAVICDLIYNPPLTELLKEAKLRGHNVMNGAGMLVEQGALAFELWTGESAPRHIMSEVLSKAI